MHASIDKLNSNMAHLLFHTAAFLLAAASFVNACPPSDRAALQAFKSNLHEPLIGIFNTWKGTDCCNNWYGVSCDKHSNRVSQISLHGKSEDPIFQRAHRSSGHMTGHISPQICKLSSLATLTVADWGGISGEIPKCIASLKSLRILDLAGNQLSGHLPPHIGKLSLLHRLSVADNKLTGSIPGSIVNLKRLSHLDIRNNRISGPIPRHIGNLNMLSRALLSGNQLSGPIPASFSNIYRLVDLDLSTNMISGPIPDSLGKMPVLGTLHLDHNRISGELPASLMNSAVSNFNASRNAIHGSIPDVFGDRSYFMVFDVSYNNLRGSIPKSMTTASYIGHLDVSHNHLCGPIPAGFEHLEESSFVYNSCLCGKPLKSC